MISRGSGRDRRSLIIRMAEGDGGWHGAVEEAALAAEGQLPMLPAVRALDGRIAALKDDEARRAFSDLMTDTVTAVFCAGSKIGYALARTWPGHIEEMDDWPDRALVYAGLRKGKQIDTPGPEHGPAEPFEGETFATLVDRSGSEPTGSRSRLDLVISTLWDESPHRRAYARLGADVLELIKQDEPVSVDVLTEIDNRHIDLECDAVAFAGRVGYALGRYAHLPEAERVARARGYAGLLGVTEINSLKQDPSPQPADDKMARLADWLGKNAEIKGESPEQAAHRLAREVGLAS